MSTAVSEFQDAFKVKGAGKRATLSISATSARNIAANLDWGKMAEIADAARDYLPDVGAEVCTLRQALRKNPDRMARRALLFAIATPKRDEQTSIGWALAAESHYGIIDAEDLSRLRFTSLVTGNMRSAGLYLALEKSIRDSQALFPTIALQDVTPDNLTGIRGVSNKVARMASAVADPDGEFFTVDMWHARQLLWASGQDYLLEVSVSKPAYPILEELWMEYRRRFFADVPMWVCQWATWNAAQGSHESHAALWNDLA